MSWFTSLVGHRAPHARDARDARDARRAGSAALLLAMCGTLPSCLLLGGGESAAAHGRCGRSYVTGVFFGASASAGAAGAWYAGGGPIDGSYDYGDWYDPGDGYDPSTNSGGITTDPNSDDGTGNADGSGWDQADDGAGSDPSADPGTDTGSDTGSATGGDSAGQAVTRLHLHDVTATPRPPSASPPPSVGEGCFACTMGCRTDAAVSPSGRQAIGVSDTSHADACASAVRTLAQWSHDTRRERLVSCQPMEAAR